MKVTNPDYLDELKKLKNKMYAAEVFANKFPYFKKEILENKMTGVGHTKLSYRYKDLYLSWGINRNFYENAKNITNYENKEESLNKCLTSVYVNSYSMYDSHAKLGLEDIRKKISIFYYDPLNTTFYLEDECLIEFLDALNDWYLLARVEISNIKKEERLRKLKLELSKLEDER